MLNKFKFCTQNVLVEVQDIYGPATEVPIFIYRGGKNDIVSRDPSLLFLSIIPNVTIDNAQCTPSFSSQIKPRGILC